MSLIIDKMGIFGAQDDLTQDGINIENYDGFAFNPAYQEQQSELISSLLKRSLLRTTDVCSYTGQEFYFRKVECKQVLEYELGGEFVTL